MTHQHFKCDDIVTFCLGGYVIQPAHNMSQYWQLHDRPNIERAIECTFQIYQTLISSIKIAEKCK